MRTRHPTRNSLDDILFLSILIITPSVVALYHGVETLAAIPEYQAVASPPSLVNARTPPIRTA